MDFTQSCTFGSYVVKAMVTLFCYPFALEFDSHCKWQMDKSNSLVVAAGGVFFW